MAERRWWHRALGLYPLTATGFAVLCASFTALVPFGWGRADHVLLVIGVAGFGLLLLCAMLTIVGSWLVFRGSATPTPPIRLPVGTLGFTGFQFTVPWWLPWVDVRWTVLAPGVTTEIVREGRTLSERFVPHRRGTSTRVIRRFEVGDVFALFSIQFERSHLQDLHFDPALGALKNVALVQGLVSGDAFAHPDGRPEGDLQDMRRYGPGDDIRHVLWKVYAKSRTLVVRSPERALSPAHKTAAYLVTSNHDQAAAGTAITAIETGALGADWVFGADGCTGATDDPSTATQWVHQSAEHPFTDGGDGLPSFLEASDAPRRVVVFAPAIAGPWVNQVISLASRVSVQVLLCLDQIQDTHRFSPTSLVLFAGAPPPPYETAVPRSDLMELCTRLAAVGDVRIVDRTVGRVFDGALVLQRTAEVA